MTELENHLLNALTRLEQQFNEQHQASEEAQSALQAMFECTSQRPSAVASAGQELERAGRRLEQAVEKGLVRQRKWGCGHGDEMEIER